MCGDRRRPKLEEEVETGVEPCEFLKRQGDELKSTRVVAPRHVVVNEAGKVVRALDAHPAREHRLESGDESAPDKHEARSPGRQEPFLRSAGEDVDSTRMHIERRRPEPLDCIDHECDAASPTLGANYGEIEAVTGCEGNPRQRDGLHSPIIERLNQLLLRWNTVQD